MQPEKPVVGPKAKQKTRDRVHVFLENYCRTGNVTKSARAAGISLRAHYWRLREDRVYAKAFMDTQAMMNLVMSQLLKAHAFEQAIHGDVPQLMRMLRRFKPAQYR